MPRKPTKKRPTMLFGFGLDDAKGHTRVTKGPDFRLYGGSKPTHEKMQELTSYLVSRRVTSEEAEKAIKEYVATLPAGDRDKKLTELFASVLAKVNSDREFVMHRIEVFQKRQKARAEEIEREGQKLSEKDQVIPPEEELGPRDATLTPEQQEYNWNARIFQERQQNITVACEIPGLIEQHVYDIAKLIRAQMQG